MKRIRFALVLLIIIFCLCVFTGCATTRKDARNSISLDENYTYTYDETTNKTTVIFKMKIANDSIYNILEEKVEFNLYLNSTLVETKTYTWGLFVKNGNTKTDSFRFVYSGHINKISYKSWDCKYDTLWNTYKIWFIASIVVTAVVIIAFIIVMILKDLSLDDMGFHFSLLFTIIIPFIPYVINGLINGDWNWVPILIIIGAIAIVILVGLIALAIKRIHDQNLLALYYYSQKLENGETDENHMLNEEKFSDLYHELMSLTRAELIEWCKEEGITGYSRMNKAQIVELIISMQDDYNDNNDNIIEEEKPKHKEKINKSTITFNDIAGLEDAKQAFRDKVVLPIQHKELYEKFGKKVGGGLLLYGLPGTGKTMFAEAASNELDALFIPIKCSDIKSKWYGESEQKVKEIFDRARKAKKAIIFFDEFEAIGAKRTEDSDNGNNDLVPQILAEMQGVGSSSNNSMILVIAATNKPWSIDSAFLRPGRFDEKIFIPLPDYEARKKLFELQLSKLPHDTDLDFDLLASLTEGCNGADIKEVCEKLKMSAINDSIKTGVEQTIGMDDVEKIKDTIKSSVQKDEIYRIEEFSNS